MHSAPLRCLCAFFTVSLGTLSAQSLQLEVTERLPGPVVDPASDDAGRALQRFSLPQGFAAHLWAAEPMLANPVAFEFDERGRLFVSETHRYRSSVLDIRNYMGMVELDLAARTLEDRVAMVRNVFGEEGARQLSIETEIVRLVEDRDGDGKADTSSIFADGFNSELDGIASGVLPRHGQVWFTNIPSLWLLEEQPAGSGTKAKRSELLRGFGVRFNYTGHDFHGLALGHDGKLYFSIGDRGAHVRGKEGQLVDVPDEGAIFRCNPDGTEFELVARGLRNPQELAFDEHGNLFTGDNDSDNGDMERLVYVVEGGDSGWRVGYQHAPLGEGGPWLREGLWKPRFPEQPAYLLPPICNIEDGPSGLTYYPGTGLSPEYRGHFFICHFKGSIARSGVQTYTVRPDGAGFAIADSKPFMGGILVTDVTFAPDGDLYVLDWVEGWPKSRKGRVYRVAPVRRDPVQEQLSAEVERLLGAGFKTTALDELVSQLAHPDRRVRLEAQWELASRGSRSIPVLSRIATDTQSAPLARLHAVWGLGQLGRTSDEVASVLVGLMGDGDAEVRAQAARLLGDLGRGEAAPMLMEAVADAAARVQFFSAQSLGKLKHQDAAGALVELLRRNASKDPYLQHAAVYALSQLGAGPALNAAAKDVDRAVRLGALLVYRRLKDPAVAQFLRDADPYLVREAAIAINDEPVAEAYTALAALLPTVPADDEPLVLRAINANFRAAGMEQARALAGFAARADLPEGHREEALIQLGLWASVPARDRLVGVYRPLPARDSRVAVEALVPTLTDLLGTAPERVRVAALDTILALNIRSVTGALAALVRDEAAPAAARAKALVVLDRFDSPALRETLTLATNASASELRLAGLNILARRAPDEALPVIARLAAGSNEVEQQAAFHALGQLEQARAAPHLIAALDRLKQGQVAVGAQFDLLDAVEKSTTPAVQERWDQLKQAWTHGNDALAPFRGALEGGTFWRGRTLFNDHPVLACIRCHKVDGDGGEAGPDLTTIGARKSPDYILESIIQPNVHIAEGFDVVSVQLANGDWDAGTVLRETAEELILKRADGTEAVLKTSEVKERQAAPSSMPAIYGQVMSRTELRDLVAYVVGLKEADPAFGEAARATTSSAAVQATGSGHE